MNIDRRRALSLLTLGAGAPIGSAAEAGESAQAFSFIHGVASGDPLQDRVILWSRVTPKAAGASSATVSWEVAEDAAFKTVVSRGVVRTGPAKDLTVKADATGLKPGRDYHYRFKCGGSISPTGRARTLPSGGVEQVVLGVVTCSLYPRGYFNAYDHLAKRPRLDVVIHLGDYIYEYGAADDDYGMDVGRRLGRIPEPAHEIVTLADYRIRHALYKRDPDLQSLHARCPWICVWDDHEVCNDDWVGGAENHQPDKDGDWLVREAAAVRAYYEWMPIREPEPGRAFEAINRSFQFGDLASLIMVESRLLARSYQLEADRPQDIPLAVYDGGQPHPRKPVTDPAIVAEAMAAAKAGRAPAAPYVLGPDVAAVKAYCANPERQMLGARQEQWLARELAESVRAGKPWQVLGNEVVMARTVAPDVGRALGKAKIDAMLAGAPETLRATMTKMVELFAYGLPYDLDGWDGYPAARERVYQAVKAAGGGNTLVLSGDSHAFWVNQLYDDAGKVRVAAELGTTSITSPSESDYVGFELGEIFQAQNPEVLFCRQRPRGYILLTLSRTEALAELVAVEVMKKPYAAKKVATFRVKANKQVGVGEIERVS